MKHSQVKQFPTSRLWKNGRPDSNEFVSHFFVSGPMFVVYGQTIEKYFAISPCIQYVYIRFYVSSYAILYDHRLHLHLLTFYA